MDDIRFYLGFIGVICLGIFGLGLTVMALALIGGFLGLIS